MTGENTTLTGKTKSLTGNAEEGDVVIHKEFGTCTVRRVNYGFMLIEGPIPNEPLGTKLRWISNTTKVKLIKYPKPEVKLETQLT